MCKCRWGRGEEATTTDGGNVCAQQDRRSEVGNAVCGGGGAGVCGGVWCVCVGVAELGWVK